MEVEKVLLTNYLPYAKGTIIGRAIPSIDGLKPSQRRVLYTMYKMKLINGGKTKSSNIVGQTMKLHPHGDQAIYETMVRMSTGHDALNAPYVESKGNFGKVYSEGIAFAAPRYTEAKLSPICEEVFDGIDEDAVDMISNFDNTDMEPTLLPVKFPSILVNPSNGIAVGLSSSIPSFSLARVCNATIGIITGKIKGPEDLAPVIGVPEFTTGGCVHTDREQLTELMRTGKGSFVVSGLVTTYPDRIVITEIPYRTTSEAISKAILEHVKSGDLKEVVNVSDEIDLKGFKLVVKLKSKVNVHKVLQKLWLYTPLRMRISFSTKVIIADRCDELGIYDLLQEWISFRKQTISRIYNHRYLTATKKEHILSTWEKIGSHMKEVAMLIISKDETNVISDLMSKYGLDEIQANYLLDTNTRQFTTDNLKKKLKDLGKVRELMEQCLTVVSNDNEKYKIIVEDLTRIIKNYGREDRTHYSTPVVDSPKEEEEEKPDDSVVNIVISKKGFIKRLTTIREISNFEFNDGDEIKQRIVTRNNEHILVFTYDGTVYKIPVNGIEAGRGNAKDELYKLVGLQNANSIMLVDASGDYSKYFNLVYPNGSGTRVYYNKFSGNRRKYKSLFKECENGQAWVTFADQFFMITAKRKASFCNLSLMGMGSRVAFKVARVNSGDRIIGLQPLDKVPDIDKIDIDRYRKEYTVCINDDILWESETEN